MLSASRIGESKNYNARKNAWLYLIQNQDEELASHTGMCSNPEVISLVIGILKNPFKPGPGGEGANPMGGASQMKQSTAQDQSPPAVPARYLTIDGGDEIVVFDALGNNTAHIPDSNARGSVPGVDLFNLGDRAMEAVLPISQVFTVTFKTADEPLAIDLRIGTGNSTTGLIRYQDIRMPAGLQARLVFTLQGMDALNFDSNHDGVYETQVKPTVDVSGTALLDTQPPKVTISAGIPQQGSIMITIAATDGGVGMKSTWYSLDGIRFIAYSGPFQVNTCQTGTVYAFADDQLANRSSLVTKSLLCQPYLYLPFINR